MQKQSVQISYDVHCDWAGSPPRYRLYVEGELFTERTFNFVQSYLNEVIPITAVPGDYVVRYEMIDSNGHIAVDNPQVISGPAEFVAHNVVRIRNES